MTFYYTFIEPHRSMLALGRTSFVMQKIGSGSAILAYKPARLLPPFRIFDFVLDTSPRQNANKFAFALGLFVFLSSIAAVFTRYGDCLSHKTFCGTFGGGSCMRQLRCANGSSTSSSMSRRSMPMRRIPFLSSCGPSARGRRSDFCG